MRVHNDFVFIVIPETLHEEWDSGYISVNTSAPKMTQITLFSIIHPLWEVTVFRDII